MCSASRNWLLVHVFLLRNKSLPFFFCCFQIGGCFPGSFLLSVHIAAEPPYLELSWAVQSAWLMELCPLPWATKLPSSFPTLWNFSVNFPTTDMELQCPFYPTSAVLPACYLQTARLCTYCFSISARICFGSTLNKTSPDKVKITVF